MIFSDLNEIHIWVCLAMLITNLKDTEGDKREFNSKGGLEQRVPQLINELSIKHASRRPCNHHVGLIPAQHDANTIYNLIKLMSLDKVKTTEGIQLKAAARDHLDCVL